MLEEPHLSHQLILSRVKDEFGLNVQQLGFLPIGADANTAVYRVEAVDGRPYFLKLRKGDFNQLSVSLPRFLSTRGIRGIIAPLETRHGSLWGTLDGFKMLLYPFVEGQDGYQVALSEQQWLEFGAAMRAIHSTGLPKELLQILPRENYSAEGRERVRGFQAMVETMTFTEPAEAQMAAAMKARREEIDHLVARAGQLGQALQDRSLKLVLCHSDIHPGNLLVSAELYIVDWDAPILAPKERDLLLIGGCTTWSSRQVVELFYRGYGQTEVDLMALAYYRYERIIQDNTAECEQILASEDGGEDRGQELRFFLSNFLPGHEVELARQADRLFLSQNR